MIWSCLFEDQWSTPSWQAIVLGVGCRLVPPIHTLLWKPSQKWSSISAAVFVLTQTQTSVNILILPQSHSPHLWEVPRWTSRPGLHLQAFGGSLASDGNCSQLPVQVFVISVHIIWKFRSQAPFCICGWGCASEFHFFIFAVCPNTVPFSTWPVNIRAGWYCRNHYHYTCQGIFKYQYVTIWHLIQHRSWERCSSQQKRVPLTSVSISLLYFNVVKMRVDLGASGLMIRIINV